MSNHQNGDVVYAAIAILTGLFGPSMAAVIGPFAVIFLASIGGAAWSVGRRPPESRSFGNDFVFFARLSITAMMVAGGIAVWGERWTGADTHNWTLPVIALLIGAVGDDWPQVGTWFAGFVRRWAAKKSDTDPNA